MPPVELPAALDHVHPAIAAFLEQMQPPTPCLVIDLEVVEARYRALSAALPEAAIHYAIKANPEPAVMALLRDLGSRFDVASPQEIDLCLGHGIPEARLSYGNTIKKQADIAEAFAQGLRVFAFDSAEELDKLAAAAPGASVVCRLLTGGDGADWPLSRKFGCDTDMAVDLLVRARSLGLDASGVGFHVGSQQRDPAQWDRALAASADVFGRCARRGVALRLVNLGGGFPAHYLGATPDIDAYATTIRTSIERHFGASVPELVVEPGRYVVADAGVLHTEVVLVARKSYGDDHRWVYLDTGVFGGLIETLGEAIKYPLTTSRSGTELGPVVLAGPTCDSLDVMYERFRYELPVDLGAGDTVSILSAGAYTSACCSDGFNGFAPMAVYCIPVGMAQGLCPGPPTRNVENCHTSAGSGTGRP
jgi:ornithine decarboxylase